MNTINYYLFTSKIKFLTFFRTTYYTFNTEQVKKVFYNRFLYIYFDTNILYLYSILFNNVYNINYCNFKTIKNDKIFTNLQYNYFNVNKSYISNVINYIIQTCNILMFNIKWLALALIISVLYFFVSLFYIQLDFTKQLAVWYLVMIAYYLLLSTFNSFLTKYKYGKFTSAIQRFWKRTGMIFWLIEGFLFLIFFYYFLNSSQEPLYMFDYSNLNQELLLQAKLSFKNMLLLSFCIYLSFILLININFLVYSQSVIILSIVSLLIFYTLYMESYQFVYILNIFGDKEWIFNDIKQLWVLEIEQNNLRIKQQYFILCLVAKYWHFIFIFISWFFFFIKTLESNKISITLLGYNTQNLLILYILNLLCLVQWFKYVSKKFLEVTYYWFYTQYDEKMYITFIGELWNTLVSYIDLNICVVNIKNIISISNNLYFSNELNIWLYL